MPYDLLSEPIRKYVRDKRWEQLRPIQGAAISRIMMTGDNYILASRTASGKTEAAFLPILSKVDFNEKGVQVLYISPLIALINDQFHRIEELCKYLEITVTKWHGEANKTLKNKIIKQPNGIVLITPESLEAMLANKPFNAKQLFSNLKYVVIDEIHSFLGTDRGVQLKSILFRLQQLQNEPFIIIGLSATIGDYEEAKRFTGDELHTKVLLDRTKKETTVAFRYFKSDYNELPLDLLEDLYLKTKDHKVLIFPNNRGRAEEVAVRLRKISEKANGHPYYFSHHSSVDKEVREYVEHFAKNNERQNFCIACTSTLELGIDIGTVDEVVQIDATYSIASMIQRVGRSGRKDGAQSNLYLYATNPWSLLQSLACWLLYNEDFIEPPESNFQPYDILLHQALSITKGRSGIALTDLVEQLKENFSFKFIDTEDIKEILNYLIEKDILEKIQREVIIGVEGERIVNSQNFYSVFKGEENFKVVHAGNMVGTVPFSPQILEDENIYLAAKTWKIIFIDFKAKRIEVEPANDGKKPTFFGSGVAVHWKIRAKMLEILYSNTQYDILDKLAEEELDTMRNVFANFKIQNVETERPLLIGPEELQVYTFAGTKINRTIGLLLNMVGLDDHKLEEGASAFSIDASTEEFLSKWGKLLPIMEDIDDAIYNLLQNMPTILGFSKWGVFLPPSFQVKLIKDKYFDVAGTKSFLETVKLVRNG